MNRPRWILSAGSAFLALGTTQAMAAPGQTAGSPLIGNVLACREVRESERRLACYDAVATQLGSDTGTREMAERPRTDRKRVSDFGFPKSGVPTRAKPEQRRKTDAPNTYDGTIVSVGSAAAYETYVLRLADGTAWRTIEAGDPPPAGEPIHIARGLIGNYLANIKGRRAIRVERVR